jgi:asparagine N-glycosylation enzyme membrane subunit Stt3
MNLSKSKVTILIVVLIALFFVLSLLFRVALPYDSIFTGGWVKFSSNDAYYHMEYVDNLVHNFPHVTAFDPYYIFPGGSATGGVHFFDWLLAIIIWIIGLGSPTQHLVDVVSAYYPAVLAALTIIPVFFIGKALFNRWVGVAAAFLTAILPGEFMGRSILGFTDNHVAETFFSTVAAMFLILAIKAAGAKQDGESPMTFSHLVKRDRKVITMPLIFSLLAGLFLGIYLITWMGALLFVFIFAVYLIIQTIVNHMRQKSSDHLGIIGFIVFLMADIILLPLSPDKNVSLAMAAALFIPPVLAVASRLISRLINYKQARNIGVPAGIILLILCRFSLNYLYLFIPMWLLGLAFLLFGCWGWAKYKGRSALWALFGLLAPIGFIVLALLKKETNKASRGSNKIFYPLSLIVLAAIVIGILYAVSPAAVNALWNNFLFVFSPGGGSTATTTMEMQPFLSPQGSFTTAVAWGNFTTSFFLIKSWPIPGFGLISLGILIWLYIKQKGEQEHYSLFIIWTLIILVATLVQRRFAYYLVVNIAVLSAYISWEIIWLAGLQRLTAKPEKNPGEKRVETSKAKTKKKPEKRPGITLRHVNVVLAIIILFFLVCFWNITGAVVTASAAPYAPSDGWEQALTWMKDNTPDPLGDPDAYYKLYNLDFKYPATAYGVTTWWDYGYWVSRIAHRLPSTNPSQAPTPITKTANLFLSENVSASNKIVDELGSSYIIADYDLIVSKLWAVVDWAQQDQNKYFDVYYIPDNGSYTARQLMTPDFYRTLAVRLYSFDGQAVAEGSPLVVTYDKKVSNGIQYKVVTTAKQYSSYKAAQDFIASQKSGNYDIVGSSPFVSPVPLEAVTNYKLVYSSQYSQSASQNVTIPEIKIFEHIK